MKQKDELTAEEQKPKIPEGIYIAYCYMTEYAPAYRGGKKLYLKFQISEGDYQNTLLDMYCPYPESKLKHTHKLHKQWCLVIERIPKKGEKFNKNVFVGKHYRVFVRDTNRVNNNRESYPEYMQYSVIDSILGVV